MFWIFNIFWNVIIRGEREEYVTQGNEGKKYVKNQKSPYISIKLVNALKAIVILFYSDYHCGSTQKYFWLTQ